ncbi:unnamed protein product, partial [Fusarium graminearum]
PGPAGASLSYAVQNPEFGLEERMLVRHDLDASARGSYGCTPLFDAVSCGRLRTVKSLLQRPEADASIAGRNGHTPLHEAVEISNLPIVEVLLQRPEVDVTTTDVDKCTPLHRAAFHAAVDITKLLLEQPAVDVASSDSEGMTPLHQAISGRAHILWHCKGGDTEATISDLVDEALENIKILLAHPEMNADLHDKKGLTPLHQACLIGDWEVAELLLQRGDVDPNARALNGQKPLHVAVSCTSSRALKLVGRLLEQLGVEITDCDFDGRTILHYIGGSLPKDWETTPIVETALREGVPIDQISTNGLKALHQAINAGNYPFANLLLSLGADPMVSKRFKYNNSLLHLCFKYHPFYEQHRDEVIEKLIAEGIEINTYTDPPLRDFDADWDKPEIDEGMRHESVEGLQSMIIANGMDCTPLMLTVTESMKIESMKMLLNAGADPNAHVTIGQRKHGKIRYHRVAFLSGVLYQAWKDGPSGYSIDPIDEYLKLLLEHGSRIDFDGPGDSSLQEACKASEDRYEAFLETLLDHSTARNVSQEHVRELICEYEKKPEHEKVLAELRAFEDRIFTLYRIFPLAESRIAAPAKIRASDRPHLSSPKQQPHPPAQPIMNSFRIARAALRARPAAVRVPLQRRTYAEAIKLSLALPHQSIYKSHDVVQVNIPAESGEMGVLANHVPSIEQLKPGLVEVVEESAGSKQFFLSGGFATVQPNSVLSINAVEGYPLEDFSAEAIRAQIAEAQKVANGSGSEQDIAEAKIELEVLETLSAHGQRATNERKRRASRDSDPRKTSLNLPQKEHRRSSVTTRPNGRDPSSRPSVTGFQPQISHGRKVSTRPSQLPRYSASKEILPPESMLTSYHVSPDPSRTVSTTEKCQDAMDILEQYGIPRPAGWFSDGGASTPDRIIQNRLMISQICHSCAKPLAFERYCSHCGHDSCIKCTGEVPGNIPKHIIPTSSAPYKEHNHTDRAPELPTQEHPTSEDGQPTRVTLDTARRRKTSRFVSEPETSKTPRPTRQKSRLIPKIDQELLKPVRKKTIAVPTEVSSSVKNNPFFMADRGTIKKPSEPTIAARSVQVERKPKHSDCVPDRLLSKSPRASHVQEECSDPSCRATHAGHHPTRHSISCTTRRSLGALVVEGNDLDMIDEDKDRHEVKHAPAVEKSPSRHNLQMKIDQLYHHGQDLHHSQHIMEHLAAGVNTLPSSATEEKSPREPDGRSKMDNYKLSMHSQPTSDHSLSQDETVTIGTETTKHSLSRDTAVPGEIESKPLNLNEHKGDRHPRPNSHEPHVNTHNDAHWIKSALGSHGQACDVQEHHSRSPTSRPTGAKPTPAPQTPNKGRGTSHEENGKNTPQAQNTPLPDKTHSVSPGSCKHPKELDEPVPGVHMLRKTVPRDDPEKPKAETTNISSWRTQLRKVDKSPEQPSNQRLTPSHVKNWRSELSSVNQRTPVSEKDKKEDCINCNPNQYISPQVENSSQSFAEVGLQKKPELEKNAAFKSPIPRLKVTDVELSLARQGDEELMAKRQELHDKEAEEQNSPQPPGKKDDPERKDSLMSTVIHDPTPMMPYKHMCAWRARYMDLKSQVDQLGDETGCPLSDGRVGTLCSHTHTDIDIEGLTVVMHFKGKDDLVVNTDLREGLQEHHKQQGTKN